VSTRISRVRKVSDPPVAALSSGSVGRRTTEPSAPRPPPLPPATAHAAPRAYRYLALTTGHRPPFPPLPSPVPCLPVGEQRRWLRAERALKISSSSRKCLPSAFDFHPDEIFRRRTAKSFLLSHLICAASALTSRRSSNYIVQRKRIDHFTCFNLLQSR